MKKTAQSRPKYPPTTRVLTPSGPGMILQETPNTYLMRPGRTYLVELNSGEKITVNEADLRP